MLERPEWFLLALNMNDSRPPSPPVAHVLPNVHTETQPHHDAAHVFLEPPASIRGDTFALLSPSARTSYTRVDVTLGDDPIRMDADATTQDHAEPTEQGAAPQPPQVSLIFLLVTGRRRTMSFEPETTVGRVKELFWNAWPSGERPISYLADDRLPSDPVFLIIPTDWQDDVPPSPSYLRILYLGKILQDEDTLLSMSHGVPNRLRPLLSH